MAKRAAWRGRLVGRAGRRMLAMARSVARVYPADAVPAMTEPRRHWPADMPLLQPVLQRGRHAALSECRPSGRGRLRPVS